MANNQAFKIKNGLSAKRYLQNSTAVSASDVDLSTGSYFTKTLSANTTFTFSNPPASGKAMGFALEVTGADVTVGYDLANASYDSVSFSVTSQASGPNGFFIKSDGTKLYVTGQTSDAVFQYTLSTAWDLSTASYDSVSFSVSSQETVPNGVFFKSDGTKMYVVGSSTDSVYQYSLSTAWDLSTASYDSVSFSVASQATIPRSVDFSSDGLNMYVSNASDDALYQYILSTAWDLSTASYASKTVSVQTQEGTLRGHAFNSNGTKLFIVGTTADTVFQYDLTTAWDISTATYSSTSFSISSQSGTPHDIFFKDDGAKMYILDGAADSLYQYSTAGTSTATTTWPSSVKWSGATAPDAPASGEKDVYVFVTTDGGTTYYGKQAGDAVA